jgi:hypothetical protein
VGKVVMDVVEGLVHVAVAAMLLEEEGWGVGAVVKVMALAERGWVVMMGVVAVALGEAGC